MITTKISYSDIPKKYKKMFIDENNQIFYKITDNESIINIFDFYKNNFHERNLYIFPTSNLLKLNNAKEILYNITEHSNKNIQLMIDSNEKEVIEKIENIGFKLRRKSFELEYTLNDLKEFNERCEVNIEKYLKDSKEYNEAAFIAFNYYIETHFNINPLTSSFDEFINILPNEVICEIKDNKIINLVFIDDNELCYFASRNTNTFNSFSIKVIRDLFIKYNSIFVEVDSTDNIALMFKDLFNNSDNNDSFNTYIY